VATKEKLEELRDILDEWLDVEEEKATRERDFLKELKLKGAVGSMNTLLPNMENHIDSDLSVFLEED